MTAALEGGEWPAPLPGRFTSGKEAVPILHESGWGPGDGLDGRNNSSLTGFDPAPSSPQLSR